MMPKKILAILMSICLIALIVPLNWTKAFASELSFSVETIIPDNQINQNATFFDLLMDVSQKQTLQIRLANNTDRDVVIVPEIATATTNHNGVVEYGVRDVERDSTLRHAIQDIVTTKEEVIVPARGSYILELNVQMPAEKFAGILAGGITLQEKEDENEDLENQTGTGLAIANHFAYVVAIVLRNNESAVTPKLQLNNVFADHINKRNVIKANIQNVMPMFMNQMSVHARVMQQGSNSLLYESTSQSLQMAPNSNMYYPIHLNGERLRAGTYDLELVVNSMGEEWRWTREFTISAEEAATLNAEDVTIASTFPWTHTLIGVIIFLTVLLLWAVFAGKRRKPEDGGTDGHVR